MDKAKIDIGRRALLGLCVDAAESRRRAVIGADCLNRKGVICDACKDACAERAIARAWSDTRMALVALNADLCTGCGDCVGVCPADAIALEAVRA